MGLGCCQQIGQIVCWRQQRQSRAADVGQCGMIVGCVLGVGFREHAHFGAAKVHVGAMCPYVVVELCVMEVAS